MNASWLDRNRNTIFITLLLLTFGGIASFYLQQPAQAPVEILAVEATGTATPAPPPSPTPGRVRVYVTGAVVHSDVYVLPQGSIIKDAILAAGGLTLEADPVRINQALELQDQQQIHIPRSGEQDGPPPVQGGQPNNSNNPSPNTAPPGTAGLVNINTASLDQLDTLPGVGPVIAQRIIDYRESFGAFQSIEAITEVSGIGDVTFANIKDLITVE